MPSHTGGGAAHPESATSVATEVAAERRVGKCSGRERREVELGVPNMLLLGVEQLEHGAVEAVQVELGAADAAHLERQGDLDEVIVVCQKVKTRVVRAREGGRRARNQRSAYRAQHGLVVLYAGRPVGRKRPSWRLSAVELWQIPCVGVMKTALPRGAAYRALHEAP